MGENMSLGFTILLTGIVIVFAVLVLLIGIIKLYSEMVVSVQKIIDDKKQSKFKDETKQAEKSVKSEMVEQVSEIPEQEDELEDDGTVPGEIVAAIAAAIDAVFGEGNVVVKSVKRASKRRSVWKSAGMAENTRSF